jgi:hypothetical protein
MGDMAEVFNAMKEHNKQIKAQRKLKYVGRLVAIGAEPKADSVWQHGDWFLYPSKGFAMNRFNTKKRMNLNKYLMEYENE